MKVLFLPKWYPNINDVQHGIFIKNQAIALSKKTSVAVLFVITSELVKEEKTEIIRDGNYTEIIIYFKKRPNRLLGLFSYYQSFKKGVTLLEKEWGKPDIITLYILGRNYMMYKKFFTGIPFIVSEQWSGYLDGKMDKYIYAKKKNTLNALSKAKKIVAVSSPLAKAIEGYSKRKVEVIPNIVKVNHITENLITEEIKILTVADLEDEVKNISGMLKALNEVSEKYRIHFRIIGEGKDEEKLKSLAKNISKDNLTIEFIPRMPHEDLLKQYTWCNFNLLNSPKETFNVAAAEACAAGRPVVSTKCGGPEIFLNDKNGILVEVNNEDSLVQGVQKMILSLRGGGYNYQSVSETINQNYGSDTIANQYFNLLSETLDKK